MEMLKWESFLNEKAQQFEQAEAEEVITWVVNEFPNITFACSFGAEDVVLVDMLQRISPTITIFYVDTDFHFAETYATRDRLAKQYNVEFMRVLPTISPEEQAAIYGSEL